MKLRPAHEKALRATLRVTLFAALGACGGGGGGAASPPATGPSNKGTATSVASPTTDADCRAALKAAYPNGDPNFYDPDKPTPRAATDTSDADLAACCDNLRTTGTTDDYRDLGCCSTKWESAKCTPWGPPMPPAMRTVRAVA